MAGLTLEYDERQFKVFTKLRKLFPELRAQAMGYVGHEGKRRLKQRFLSGQELNLTDYPKDKAGRRTINYTVGKFGGSVRISSYPLNLFERGRLLRSGRKEPGKRILTGKFKKMMMGDLQGILREYDSKYMQKRFDKEF